MVQQGQGRLVKILLPCTYLRHPYVRVGKNKWTNLLHGNRTLAPYDRSIHSFLTILPLFPAVRTSWNLGVLIKAHLWKRESKTIHNISFFFGVLLVD